MNHFYAVLSAEVLKIKRSPILPVSFFAFAIAPVMGGLFIMLLNTNKLSGALHGKAVAMNFSATWTSYVGLLSQATGVGGILVFGFVCSWVFGREYSDNTAKDLLALPSSRTSILNAKFLLYVIWAFALALSNLLLALIIGTFLNLPSINLDLLAGHLETYFISLMLTLLAGTPVALFALLGRGYLAPLGFVAFTLVIAQIIAAIGYGNYFPWSVPGLYSGAAGEYRSELTILSYTLLIITGMVGYVSTLAFWRYADQAR